MTHLALSAPATRFLTLHAALQPPQHWKWHLLETQLRATSEGETRTIWRDDLEALVGAGLLRKGEGCADYYVTEAGRAALEREEA